MEQPEMRSFEEFWPFYVSEHSHPSNRALHFMGSTLAMGSLAAGLLTRRPGFFLAAPLLGYGCAWVGHFLVEGNRPATFKYPLWSLRGDARMWWKTLTGVMEAEVERVAKEASAAHDAAGNGVHGEPANDSAAHAQPMN
jgi:hypothetical protein